MIPLSSLVPLSLNHLLPKRNMAREGEEGTEGKETGRC
jgi:hypothetical protein